MSDTPAIAIIPARYQSSRFPGKPLADETGQPLIQHVIDRVRLAQRVTRTIVATDDQRIFDVVSSFGSEAIMTRQDHPNGTSRLAEVLEILDTRSPNPRVDPSQIIVNVQGDEPEIDPKVIDALIEGLCAESGDHPAPMATVVSPFSPDEDPSDPNIVKVVTARVQGRHRALYFSRSLIPFDRDHTARTPPLKHLGIYAYRRSFLPRYAQLPPTPLEQSEQLEQLRALEHGYPIAVIRVEAHHHGIDTPLQYDEFVKRYRASRQT